MRKILGLVVLALSLCACSRHIDEKRVEVSLASKLISNNQLASFSFRDEGLGAWDSILVLKPYCPSKEMHRFGVKNYLTATLVVPTQEYDDFNCTLVFLKNGCCVGYSVVSRQIVDLAGLTNEKESGFALITKTNCVRKLHRECNKGYCGVSMVD